MFSWKWSSFIFGCKFIAGRWPSCAREPGRSKVASRWYQQSLKFQHRSPIRHRSNLFGPLRPLITVYSFVVPCLARRCWWDAQKDDLQSSECSSGRSFSSLLDRKSESKHDTTNEPDLKMRSDQLPKTPLYTPTFCPDPVGNSIKYSSP